MLRVSVRDTGRYREVPEKLEFPVSQPHGPYEHELHIFVKQALIIVNCQIVHTAPTFWERTIQNYRKADA